MPFFLKLLITNLIIIGCARIAVRMPTLAGLIATMPLTSLLVLVWIKVDNPGDCPLLTAFTRGVLWGIVPTLLFFGVVLFCFKREVNFTLTLAAGFSVWLTGAFVHQWLTR